MSKHRLSRKEIIEDDITAELTAIHDELALLIEAVPRINSPHQCHLMSKMLSGLIHRMMSMANEAMKELNDSLPKQDDAPF